MYIFLKLKSPVFHDRTRPLSTNSGHCLENDAGSQLEDADKATSSLLWLGIQVLYSESFWYH
jgi:hypothetical protein